MSTTTTARVLGLTIALLAVGLGATAATASAQNDDTTVTHQRYVGALSTPQNLPVQHKMAVCGPGANVGGLCDEPVPTETNLAIRVHDTVLGGIPFHWQSTDADGEAGECPGGHSVSHATLNVPPGCGFVDVYVGAPATVGTITIEEADAVII